MEHEVTSTGTFWLPARGKEAPVSCRYQVVSERGLAVYRLLYIYEQPAA